MGLYLSHPHLPSCDDCKKFVHDDEWRVKNGRDGLPMVRPEGTPTPCRSCPKIPGKLQVDDPRPENAIVLSQKNATALWYYQLCDVDNRGILPQDELTLQNHAVIKTIIERHKSEMANIQMLAMAGLGGKR